MRNVPDSISQAIIAYGYASRHPEDADVIASAYQHLIESIQVELAQVSRPIPQNYDRVTSRLGQVAALVAATFGGSGDAFRSLSDEIQDNYMWAISDHIRDINEGVATFFGETAA